MPKKNRRGVTPLYLETKVKVGLSLTPSGAERLNTIAKKLRISKSELIERIARGDFSISGNTNDFTVTLKTGAEVGKIATTLPDQQDDSEMDEMADSDQPEDVVSETTAEPNHLLEDYQALQQQSQEQAAEISSLQQQLAKLQQLETQVQQSVSRESYEALQRQSLEHQTELASVQQQLAKLQQLETQVQQSVPRESYEALQRQSLEHQTELASVQQQLETQVQQSVSRESYEALQRQSLEQTATIAHLKQQIAHLQSLQQPVIPTVSLQSYQALHRHSEEQAKALKALQQQLAELQRLATVGETHLNKWRKRSF